LEFGIRARVPDSGFRFARVGSLDARCQRRYDS
jgi:hypothetical protein